MDVSDHFPIFFSIQLNTTKEKCRQDLVNINNRNITSFKEQLSLLGWRHTDFNGTVSETYETFPSTLTAKYDANLPIQEHILKDTDIKASKAKV